MNPEKEEPRPTDQELHTMEILDQYRPPSSDRDVTDEDNPWLKHAIRAGIRVEDKETLLAKVKRYLGWQK